MTTHNALPAPLSSLAVAAMQCNACFAGGDLKRSYVDLPQPRYIGPGYWSSNRRIAWVMINPGAGAADHRNRSWRDSLIAFRTGQASLQAVFDEQRKHMPTWNAMLPFIGSHGLDVDDLALLNVAWCASEDNRYPTRMLDACWERHSGAWLKSLAPAVIVLSGTRTHDFVARIRALLPGAKILTAFHYAHRPLDHARAMQRAEEIRQELAR